MVRRHNYQHDYDNANTRSSRRDPTAARLSLLEVAARRPYHQPKGRFAFTRAISVLSTRTALPNRRLRFALLLDNKWRREERDLKTFPRAVILKRFATAFRVLLRATDFGIRRGS